MNSRDLQVFGNLEHFQKYGHRIFLTALALYCFTQAAIGSPLLTALHGFSIYPEGADPEAPLIQARDGNFYGTTVTGGTNGGFGTIFRMSTSGIVTTLYTFTGGSDGANPFAGLVQGTDGYLYGTAKLGGNFSENPFGEGTIFRISTNGVFTTIYTFTNGSDGSEPVGGLIQASDGTFYGTAQAGGEIGGFFDGDGTIFQVTTNGNLTVIYTFTGGSDGSGPAAGVIQGADGNLYGTAESGGDGDGTIFQATTNGGFNVLYTFTDSTDGSGPAAALVQCFDGSLYGTAQNGGDSFGDGTIFQVTTNGAFTMLYDLAGGSGGSHPQASLVQDTNGILYGTTRSGGTHGDGTIFQITTNGAFSSLYSFAGGDDGATPKAGLLQGGDGQLYGTTEHGDTNGLGAIFRISTSGIYAALFVFPGTNDGITPSADLVLGQDGNYYGTTEGGGKFGSGEVFRASTNGVVTPIYNFGTMGLNTNNHGLDGAISEGALVQGSNGTFYGTTSAGGTNDVGTVFSITTNGVFTLLHTFNGTNDGANPWAGMIFGKDGSLYGTTVNGGVTGTGSIFQITTNGNFATVVSLDDTVSGPYCTLVQDSNGYLYGTTIYAAFAWGSVFQATTSGAYTNLYTFTGGDDGANPVAGLVQGNDGFFYGTTENKGTFGDGTVFKIDSSGNFTVLAEFDGANGAAPYAPLKPGNDGNFYGSTYGGPNGEGTLFQVTKNGVLTTLWTFTGGHDGANPDDALIPAGNGLFYGLTQYAGAGGMGELFQLDLRPTIESISKTGKTVTFDWAAVAGLNYQIQYSTNLLNPSAWVNFGSSIPATNNPMQAAVSVGPDARRFYRMALLP